MRNTQHARRVRSSVLASAISALLGSAGTAGVAAAQEARPVGEPAASALEEITVTGSRIARRDFVANSPITTVDQDMIENISTLSLENVLNRLPQFVPAVTQFVTQDVQNNATNTPGASTISMRGLGPNRNLVLMDGRRAMPVNASMAVDTNTIPTSIIQRIEVISGGASAVYGADAVGGVVNFILKRDFEGAEIDVQYGVTERGDGTEFRVAGLLGANFANDRGNVIFSAEHYDRGDVKMKDRRFYRDAWADPTVGGTEFFYSDTAYIPGFMNPPNQAVIDGIFDQADPGAVGATSTFFLNTDQTIYTGGRTFGAGNAAGAYRYNGPTTVDGLPYRLLDSDGLISENQLNNLISIPMTRYSSFGRGEFELADRTHLYVQGNFSRSSTETVLQFSPASNGWSTLIPYGNDIYAPSLADDGVTTNLAFQSGQLYGLDCPATGGCTNSQAFPVPAELAALLDSRADPDAPWQLNRVLDFLPPRGSESRTTSYQLVTGVTGDLRLGDWTWDTSISHGETEIFTSLTGFGSLERYRAIVGEPNYGRNAFLPGNQGAPGNGFAAATGQCTSGLPIIEDFEISDDCIEAISANLQNNAIMTQNVFELNLQGGIAELPAGEMRAAVGVAYRENDYQFRTDILTSQASFLDGGIGLFPAGDSGGRVTVQEIYGELLLPILSDLPMIRELNLELGYRYSDYNTVGGVDTYKILGDWSINDTVRFRGGYQLANRAPNIGELFQARTQEVTFSVFGDVCSENATAPWSANPAVNANAAQVRAICETLMGATGAANYYDGDQPMAGPGITLTNTVGNPNLDTEEAKTWTIGAVISSRSDHPLLQRMSLVVDWYSIEITDLIAVGSQDVVYQECFDPSLNPALDVNAPACQQIVRDPSSGLLGSTEISYTNEGRVKTSGFDVQFNWSADLADLGMGNTPGSINLNVFGNIIDSYKTQLNPNAEMIDWRGSLGPNFTSLNPGAYRYRTFTTLSYFNAGFNVDLRWRHLPSVDQASVVTGVAEGDRPLKVKSYNMIDLTGGWMINEMFSVRAGIDNVFGFKPRVTNAMDSDNPSNVTNGGMTNASFYDVLGRRVFVGLKAQF